MYIVEGNIGVGKSTFLKSIKKLCPEIETIQEPVNTWAKDVSGHSLLDNFYKEPTRWAYTMETLTMIYRTRDYTKEQENTNPNRIMERSVYSGHYCFAYNDLDSGFFSSIEWEIYNKWATFLLQGQCRPPHGFIYLQASPDVCFQRVKKRNRVSEASLSIDVLNKIHEYHERFLIEKRNLFDALKNTPVLVLKYNENIFENPSFLQDCKDQVVNFLQQTQAARRAENINSIQDSTAERISVLR